MATQRSALSKDIKNVLVVALVLETLLTIEQCRDFLSTHSAFPSRPFTLLGGAKAIRGVPRRVGIVMKPVIYQIVVRYFGNTNTTNQQDGTIETNGCSKFADITETALQALKDLGVTHVWLTGCLRQ